MNSYYRKLIQEIRENKARRLEGKLNAIPWPSLPKLCTKIPGIEKEQYVLVTANSKVGKSQLGDFLYVLEPYKFIKENPDCGLSLKIFYFSLEISKKRKLTGLLSNKIYNETGKIISPQNINSKFSNYILEDEIEDYLEHYIPHFEEFEKTVEIIDNVRNPYGIYKYIQNYAESHGDYVKKEMVFTDNDTKQTTVKVVNDYYIPHNPNELVIIIVDHLSLLQPEKGENLHSAMSKFSSDYALHMRDVWKYCVVGIQQQSAESEKQQYTMSGNSIITKLRPSADGLGDNKLIGRDVNLMFGLFAPHRYDIPVHNGYDIKKLGDNYRELSVLFNRDGEGFFTDDLLFNGAVNFFAEAPSNRDKMLSKEDYDNILRQVGRNS